MSDTVEKKSACQAAFDIKEHTIDAQHIRELPDAIAIDETHPEAALQLHVKQYVPRNNPRPQAGDLTILAFHANGYCKETYEPIWTYLLASLPSTVRIRSIWAADTTHQGSSYLLNESKLGPGVAWDDHARDILHMTNHFRNDMPQPVLGVGHSMGAVQLIRLATLHPRLFHSIALFDPWLYTTENTSPILPITTLKPAIVRKDLFPNAETAIERLQRNPVFKSWDQSCLQIYLSHLLRETPTLLHPNPDPKMKVTLRTPKQMEALSISRANPRGLNMEPSASRLERLLMPYMSYDSPLKAPTSNPITKRSPSNLLSLRPRCLFLYGTKSPLTRGEQGDKDRKRNLHTTGVEAGGSGGEKLGCVSEGLIPGGHLFPFEQPQKLGERLASWLREEAAVWTEEKRAVQEELWKGKESVRDRQQFGTDFIEAVRNWDGDGWSNGDVENRRVGPAKANL